MTEIKGKEFANGIARMKKAEAAAYAETQANGTAWLPSPISPAVPKADDGNGGLLAAEADEDSDDDATDMTDDADIVEFPEAAE